jgi:hypothetical protein
VGGSIDFYSCKGISIYTGRKIQWHGGHKEDTKAHKGKFPLCNPVSYSLSIGFKIAIENQIVPAVITTDNV